MEFDPAKYIIKHLQNSHAWHPAPFLPAVHLPSFLTVHTLFLLVVSCLLIFIFGFVYKKTAGVPTGMTNLLEMFVVFIRDEISIACLGPEDGRKMTPLFCTYFFFILMSNLLGLIPVFPTVTSNVSLTCGLALSVLSFMILGSIYKNGFVHFIKIFVPSGVPLPVLLILTPIEFMGVFIKAFALMIRLFANMLAGHIVILAILSLVVILGLVALPVVFLAVFISLLEVFVSFLQAYIFTLLSALFIGQMYHPEH